MNYNDILAEWQELVVKSGGKKKDLTKLTPVQKQVSRGGKTFTTTVYVNQNADEKKDRPKVTKEEASSPKLFADYEMPKTIPASEVQKHLKPIRKNLGSDRYKEFLQACGVKWERNTEHDGADTLRASSAAKKFLEGGGKLDKELFDHMRKGGPAETFKKKKDNDNGGSKPTAGNNDSPKGKDDNKPAKPKEAPKKNDGDQKGTDEKPADKKDGDSGKQGGISLNGNGKSSGDGTKETRDFKDQAKDMIDKAEYHHELEAGLKRLGLGVAALEKMSFEDAKMVAVQTHRFYEKFPQLSKTLRNIGTIREARSQVAERAASRWGKSTGASIKKGLSMSNTTMAYFASWNHPKISRMCDGIYLNNKWFADGKVDKAEIRRLKDTQWLATGNLTGATVHEIGHAVHYSMKDEITPALSKLYKSYTKDEIRGGLSRYGSTKLNEFIAEGFAEFYTSDNPRPIAKEIGKIFEDAAKVKEKTN